MKNLDELINSDELELQIILNLPCGHEPKIVTVSIKFINAARIMHILCYI